MPLHGERGGPLFCVLCAGAWQEEHVARRRAERVLIKALKAYKSVGGHLWGPDFDLLRLGIIFADKSPEDFRDLTLELLTATLALAHPDKHPPERKAEAERVTQELLSLKPFVFPALPPPPLEPPSDDYLNERDDTTKEPSLSLLFRCDDCRGLAPDLYCDSCRANWEAGQRKREARKEEQRIKENARRRERYRLLTRHRDLRARAIACESCGKEFKPKRTDAKYCSAACRQRAYVKRDLEGAAGRKAPAPKQFQH
jgi:hypothetical protein